MKNKIENYIRLYKTVKALQSIIVVLTLLILNSKMSIAQINQTKKAVLLTLEKNEILISDEYYVSQELDKNHFACMVKDTISNKQTFIYNGQRVFSGEPNSFTVLDFDVNSKNDYKISYKENDKFMVKCRGRIEGPYEDVVGYKSRLYYVNTDKVPEKFDYFYQLADRWYSSYKGEITQLESNSRDNWSSYGTMRTKVWENGKHMHVLDVFNGNESEKFVTEDSIVNFGGSLGNLAIMYLKNGRYYFKFNDKTSPPFNADHLNSREYNHSDIYVSGSNYMYTYKKDGKTFININGNISSPITGDVRNAKILPDGSYVYAIYNDRKSNLVLNGKRIKEMDGLDGIEFHSYGYAFVYNKGDEVFININGKKSKGYVDIHALDFRSNGTYSYRFIEKDGWIYENNNGIVKKTQNRKIPHNTYLYTSGHRLFENSIEKYELISSNSKHDFYTNYRYDYVIIDGKRYGNAPAIKAWYDKTNNTFAWNAWENKDLVLYELQLD